MVVSYYRELMNVYLGLTSETRLLISDAFDSKPINIISVRDRRENAMAPLGLQIFAHGDIR